MHRNRITELEKHCEAFEKKLAGLQEQQNFYMIMKKDYKKFYDIARKSMEKATLFNPFIPTGNYLKDDLLKLPELKTRIVDIRDSIQENKETVERLSQELKVLRAENKELQSYSATVNDDNLGLRQTVQRISSEKQKLLEDNRVRLQKTKADLKEALDEKRKLELKVERLSTSLNEMKKYNDAILEFQSKGKN